jgi:CRP/FNR family transcriptional regulator
LSEFKKDGMIELEGKKIQILKPKQLLATANLQD